MPYGEKEELRWWLFIGELYGVPQEAGTFTFGVRVSFTSTRENYTFPDKSVELTLTVNENTNDNVYGATDTGYEILEHVGRETSAGTHDYILIIQHDQLFVSVGEFTNFETLWLNGKPLVEARITQKQVEVPELPFKV